MAYTIAITNKKGGIGKTTTALCLSDVLRNKGYKVLTIDADPQQSTSSMYGYSEEQTANEYALSDILYEESRAEEVVIHSECGDIILADDSLDDAETRLPMDITRFTRLQDSLESVQDKYDFIIIDCPPAMGAITANVLVACDGVVVPITADRFGCMGLNKFQTIYNNYKKRLNPKMEILGILIVMYKKSQNLTKDLESNLIEKQAEMLGTSIFDTHIRECVKCKEAQTLGKSLMKYAPYCTTAFDYKRFADEIIKKTGRGE